MNWHEAASILLHSVPVSAAIAALLVPVLGILRPSLWNRKLLLGTLVLAGVAAGVETSIQPPDGDSPPAWDSYFLNTPEPEHLGALLLTGAVALTFLFWKPSPQIPPAVRRREAAGAMGVVSAILFLSTANSVWVEWGCLIWIGWLLGLVLGRDLSDGQRGCAVAAMLVWMTVADLFWLTGIVSMGMFAPSGEVSLVVDNSVRDQMTAGDIAGFVSGLSLIVAALVLRCGFYPLMGWAGSLALSYRDAAWIIAAGFGAGMIALLRWQPILSAFSESQLLLQGIGILSSLILSVMAWGGTHGPTRLVYASAAQLGLVWFCAGTTSDVQMELTIAIMATLWLLTMFAFRLSENVIGAPRSPFARWGAFLSLALLCLFPAILESRLPVILRSELSEVQRWGILLAATFSEGMILYCFLRESQFVLSNAPAPDPEGLILNLEDQTGTTSFPFELLVIAVWGLLTLGLDQAGDQPFKLIQEVQHQPPILSLLLLFVAWIASRTWPTMPARWNQSPEAWKGVLRMAQMEFYIPAVLQFAILLPIRAASQISRLLEWIVFGNLTLKLPANISAGIYERATLTDEESTNSMRAWQMITAVAAMLMGTAISLLI